MSVKERLTLIIMLLIMTVGTVALVPREKKPEESKTVPIEIKYYEAKFKEREFGPTDQETYAAIKDICVEYVQHYESRTHYLNLEEKALAEIAKAIDANEGSIKPNKDELLKRLGRAKQLKCIAELAEGKPNFDFFNACMINCGAITSTVYLEFITDMFSSNIWDLFVEYAKSIHYVYLEYDYTFSSTNVYEKIKNCEAYIKYFNKWYEVVEGRTCYLNVYFDSYNRVEAEYKKEHNKWSDHSGGSHSGGYIYYPLDYDFYDVYDYDDPDDFADDWEDEFDDWDDAYDYWEDHH